MLKSRNCFVSSKDFPTFAEVFKTNDMKKIVKKESNFEFFNPNPTAKKTYKSGAKAGKHPKWDKPDCVIRAFSGATGKSWEECYDILCEIGRKRFDVPNSRETLDEALAAQGFKKVSIKVESGSTRPTVAELAKQTIGKVCVFNIAHHEVAARDGKYLDVWDCGYKSVYNYWEK